MALHIYTRYVKILRLVLPTIAILGFLSLLIWPWWRERQQQLIDLAEHAANPVAVTPTPVDTTAPLQVEKPDYQGVDTKGRAYRVTASRVEQNLNPKAPILLIEPLATLTLEAASEGTPERAISLQGQQGIYDAQSQTLDLKGKVILNYLGDYDIQAEDLAVDLAEGAAMTTTPVEGRGPRGFLSGQSLNIADKGAVIVLKGPSKLVLQPQDKPAEAPSVPSTTPQE